MAEVTAGLALGENRNSFEGPSEEGGKICILGFSKAQNAYIIKLQKECSRKANFSPSRLKFINETPN